MAHTPPRMELKREPELGTVIELDEACIEGVGYRPFCALSTELDPRCAGSNETRFCDDDWIVRCIDGYASPFIDWGERGCGGSYCW